jgi:ech hydrogenase subunit A
MNTLIYSLVVIPIVFAILFLIKNDRKYYKLLSYLLFICGAVLSIAVSLKGPQKLLVTGTLFTTIEAIITLLEVAIILFLFYVSVKNKRWGVFALTIIQTLITIYSTLTIKGSEEAVFNLDMFTLVMLLIVNIIGTLIVVFANGYITVYEHHKGLKNKQKLFYSVICIFLAAMNGLVLSDSLSWIYFFWEITTLTSFILISYNGDEEALNSGFRALFLNLVGGVSFAIGNIVFYKSMNITSLTGIIQHGKVGSFYVIPVFLLCIAGFAKSAQVPFQSWLLGAMVAPTPVSALLHSSTMVKAGVYLIVKLSPAYAGTTLGTAIALYGAFTFILCSAIAVSQRNAKRVLAYSTIANLGLIICSAGIGSAVAVSAAIILLIFHAISKALLFLCTGQIEHTIGSRDIEDMSGLVYVAPMLTLIISFAMLSMILPPFGVLVTKWISIEAAAVNPVVVILLILGSALTTLYYLKWIGTLMSHPVKDIERPAHKDFSIYFPLWVLSILILVTSVLMKPIYNLFVAPEISVLLKESNALSVANGTVSIGMGTFNNGLVFIVIGIVLVLLLLVKKSLFSTAHVKSIYMCGENNVASDENSFRCVNGTHEKAVVSNFYLNKVLDEKAFTTFGYIISIAMIITVLIGGLL